MAGRQQRRAPMRGLSLVGLLLVRVEAHGSLTLPVPRNNKGAEPPFGRTIYHNPVPPPPQRPLPPDNPDPPPTPADGGLGPAGLSGGRLPMVQRGLLQRLPELHRRDAHQHPRRLREHVRRAGSEELPLPHRAHAAGVGPHLEHRERLAARGLHEVPPLALARQVARLRPVVRVSRRLWDFASDKRVSRACVCVQWRGVGLPEWPPRRQPGPGRVRARAAWLPPAIDGNHHRNLAQGSFGRRRLDHHCEPRR